MMRARHYAADETIIQSGSEPSAELLFVANGIVTVETTFGVRVIADGGIFGIESVLRLDKVVVSAVAETPVQLMMLAAQDARDLVRRHPELEGVLLAQIAEQAGSDPEDQER